ncbi:MAG: hypothetical protein QM765_36365 [Myxococcales bacterium]
MAASLWFGRNADFGFGDAAVAYLWGGLYLPLSVGMLFKDAPALAVALVLLWGMAILVCCDQLVRKRRWAFAPAVFLLLLVPTPALPEFFVASMGV